MKFHLIKHGSVSHCGRVDFHCHGNFIKNIKEVDCKVCLEKVAYEKGDVTEWRLGGIHNADGSVRVLHGAEKQQGLKKERL